MKESFADDSAKQPKAEYEKNNGAFQKMLDTQTASKVEMEKELADLSEIVVGSSCRICCCT